MGVLTGCGLQKISMVSTVFGYYLLSCPVGLVLAFRKELGVFGMCVDHWKLPTFIMDNRFMDWCRDWLVCTGKV